MRMTINYIKELDWNRKIGNLISRENTWITKEQKWGMVVGYMAKDRRTYRHKTKQKPKHLVNKVKKSTTVSMQSQRKRN